MDQLNTILHIDSICRQRFVSDKKNLLPAKKILVERDVYEFTSDDRGVLPTDRPFAELRERAVTKKLSSLDQR